MAKAEKSNNQGAKFHCETVKCESPFCTTSCFFSPSAIDRVITGTYTNDDIAKAKACKESYYRSGRLSSCDNKLNKCRLQATAGEAYYMSLNPRDKCIVDEANIIVNSEERDKSKGRYREVANSSTHYLKKNRETSVHEPGDNKEYHLGIPTRYVSKQRPCCSSELHSKYESYFKNGSNENSKYHLPSSVKCPTNVVVTQKNSVRIGDKRVSEKDQRSNSSKKHREREHSSQRKVYTRSNSYNIEKNHTPYFGSSRNIHDSTYYKRKSSHAEDAVDTNISRTTKVHVNCNVVINRNERGERSGRTKKSSELYNKNNEYINEDKMKRKKYFGDLPRKKEEDLLVENEMLKANLKYAKMHESKKVEQHVSETKGKKPKSILKEVKFNESNNLSESSCGSHTDFGSESRCNSTSSHNSQVNYNNLNFFNCDHNSLGVYPAENCVIDSNRYVNNHVSNQQLLSGQVFHNQGNIYRPVYNQINHATSNITTNNASNLVLFPATSQTIVRSPAIKKIRVIKTTTRGAINTRPTSLQCQAIDTSVNRIQRGNTIVRNYSTGNQIIERPIVRNIELNDQSSRRLVFQNNNNLVGMQQPSQQIINLSVNPQANNRLIYRNDCQRPRSVSSVGRRRRSCERRKSSLSRGSSHNINLNIRTIQTSPKRKTNKQSVRRSIDIEKSRRRSSSNGKNKRASKEGKQRSNMKNTKSNEPETSIVFAGGSPTISRNESLNSVSDFDFHSVNSIKESNTNIISESLSSFYSISGLFESSDKLGGSMIDKDDLIPNPIKNKSTDKKNNSIVFEDNHASYNIRSHTLHNKPLDTRFKQSSSTKKNSLKNSMKQIEFIYNHKDETFCPKKEKSLLYSNDSNLLKSSDFKLPKTTSKYNIPNNKYSYTRCPTLCNKNTEILPYNEYCKHIHSREQLLDIWTNKCPRKQYMYNIYDNIYQNKYKFSTGKLSAEYLVYKKEPISFS